MLINHSPILTSPDGYSKLIDMFASDNVWQLGKVLHAHLIINGLARLTYLASKLIAFYTECGQLSDARKLFDEIPETHFRRWIVLIGAYARNGFHQEAMGVFCELQREGLRPNKFVLPSILKACGHLSDLKTGEKMHTLVLKHEFEADAFVNCALIDMYSKCGKIENARRVFDVMVEKDLVTTNAMVSGYVQHRFVKEAIGLLEKMQIMGVKPNVVTWNTLIAGFSQAGDELMVSQLFKLMQDAGVEPDVVSWTTIISGFVKNFRNNEAFHTFKQMMGLQIYPSSATISSLLPACATLANLSLGKEIHGYGVVIGVEEDIYVRTALLDMYAKCGIIYEARTLFEKMGGDGNTVTWNSMIFGYANHGYCNEAIKLFEQMLEGENKVDYLTFVAALTACSHGGMIELGRSLFSSMKEKYGINPRSEHYACLVDLLGKAGELMEAYDLIQKMPIEPDLFVWGALLGACKQHGNVDLAQIAAKHLSKLEPESSGSDLLLSSLYADVGNWANVAKVNRMVKKRKLRKFPGCSWIDAV